MVCGLTKGEYYLQADEYKLSIDGSSRIDEFCFMCKHLKFTQNNTHLKCGMNIPRYLEPSVTEATIRPTGAGKGPSGICAQLKPIRDDETLTNRYEWRTYFENKLKKQIMDHEKIAKPIEMYRVESVGSSTADSGVNAVLVPISRDNILGGRTIVLIDKANKKVWVHAGRETPKGLLTGMLNILAGMAGSMEDACSTRYLRDLLKRDIESFQIEKIWANEETPEFWATIDKGASEPIEVTPTEKAERPAFQGPKIEMYQLNYHIGRGYSEYYTGGRSASESKAITLEPLKTSSEEFDKKRTVVVVDHQDKIIWHWIGAKNSLLLKPFIKRIPSDSKSRNQHLATIGSRIGRPVDNYDYVVIEESKEPEKFKRLFQ